LNWRAIWSNAALQNIKFQYSRTKTKNRFKILKLGTLPQGGESKRSADNFGHCDLFDICDLLFGISMLPITSKQLAIFR
ncbi:MAG: hypothetical protein ACWGP1_13105, partial [Syntrophobacteria bacterium]